MAFEPKTSNSANAIIERAEKRGLTADRSQINPQTVRRNLRPKSKKDYSRVLAVWHSYGPSDPRDMQVMKHFAETLGRGMKGKLDEEDELPTPDSLRVAMRRFYNAWNGTTIWRYPWMLNGRWHRIFKGHWLKCSLWFKDYYDYAHEGCPQPASRSSHRIMFFLSDGRMASPSSNSKLEEEYVKERILIIRARFTDGSILRKHYLGTMNTVDGAASYLGMDIRNDLTEDFRSATMRWNSDLPLELSAKGREELEQNEEYATLSRLIERLYLQINDENTPEEARQRLREQRNLAYSKRRRLERSKLRECQQKQPKVYPTGRKAHEENDWRRDHFLRVLHMMPERRRLFRTLSLRVPLRSLQGISALRDLITLRESDCRVAYQDVLKPKSGRCPNLSCNMDMESIPAKKRWKHTYRCSEMFYEKTCGFAQFCFLCSCWITNQKAWSSFVTPSPVQDIVLFTSGEQTFQQICERSSISTPMPGNVISPNAYRLTSMPELGGNSDHAQDSAASDSANLIDLHLTTSSLSGSTSPISSDKDSLWDQVDDSSDVPTELSSQSDSPAQKHLHNEGRYFPNTLSPVIPDISGGPESQSPDSSAIFPPENYNKTSPRLPAWLVDPELQRFSDDHRDPQINTLDSDLDSTHSKNHTAQIPFDLSTRDRQTAGAKAHLLKDPEVRMSGIIQAIQPEAVAEETSRHGGQDNEVAYSTLETPKGSSEGYYTVECLLDEWKGWFYVKWGDGSYSWQPRGNILDRGLIEDVRKDYKGLGPGVEILRTRRAKGKKAEYRVHFKGRPSKEDVWVMEKFLSPELIRSYKDL
ncbi:hypothetical protein B0T26DRAFT_675041 [Lasiosphaeria miniovina]|uniref:Uncharacterized protein n=1 Tax=Lasiosphaeria miniovina TaxID=1954250 RepID=A0AA40AWV0_9PEZI|nr:uncharacterized protein B0T26DRAFT_675041 [Lasiosphaeria miniovina]KAK0723474.1 hypothetical protein B0T26DRAFT_675041 [Lasiosphaeria miniovina]